MLDSSSMTRAPESALAQHAATLSGPELLRRLGRGLVGVLVAVYLGLVLLAPLAALAAEVVELGPLSAARALVDESAWHALKMTLVLSALAVGLNAVFGTLGAIVLVRQRFLLRPVVQALADLPLAVSPVMVGLAFILMFGRSGWLEPLSRALHIQMVFSFSGLLLGTLFVCAPYTLREIAYVLEELGTSEEEAAATLGAKPWQIFFQVTLPNIRFTLAYGLLMTFARSIGEFGAVLLLGGSISGQTQTATTFIHDALDQRNTAAAYSMAVLLGGLSMSLLLALHWLKRRTEKTR